MEVIYRACDGKIFKNAEEAVIYEQTLAIPMYGENGKTNDLDRALVVALNNNSAKLFINACEKVGTLYDGIEEGDKGIFVWDYSDDNYSAMDVCVFDALRHYFKDNP